MMRKFVLALALVAAPANAATLTALASFTAGNGNFPYGKLATDAQGNLYGTTNFGGGPTNVGTVFKLDIGTSTLTDIVEFSGPDGAGPLSGLIADAQGNFYGTTASGGASQRGTVFKVDGTTHALTTLASFSGANGASPSSALIADAQGNLYGTTTSGGASNNGTVYRIAAGTNQLTTLATFTGGNGAQPVGGLAIDAQGNLYGTARNGGGSNEGTVFKIAAGTNALTTLATFVGGNGEFPLGQVILDGQGYLYGTTLEGGSLDVGTVFKLNLATNALSRLATFGSAGNGSRLTSGLIIDAAGNLFGTTISGGTSNAGTVFRVDAGTNALNTLASFGGVLGENPFYAPLIADAQGNLYGTAVNGGASNRGTIFKVSDAGFVTSLPPPPVPEPSIWLAMIIGFGLIGGASRYRANAVRAVT